MIHTFVQRHALSRHEQVFLKTLALRCTNELLLALLDAIRLPDGHIDEEVLLQYFKQLCSHM